MFIHLGEDFIIRMSDVIAIFSYESLIDSTINKTYFKKIKEEKKVIDMANGSIKSVVITEDVVYFTPLSTATLKKRSQTTMNLS